MTTRSREETERRPVDEDTDVCYLYAIVPADARLPEGLTGTRGGEVSLVRHEDLAVAVSMMRPDKALGTRDDLLAHNRVLSSLAEETTTLPLRFGAVVTTAEAAIEEMLAPNYEWFEDVMDDLAGRREFAVVGIYVEDVVIQEVLDEQPEASQLRERIRELPEDAAYYDRIRLGEIIVQALDGKRNVDTEALMEALTPYTVDAATRQAASEDTAVDAVFLVDDAAREDFEQTLDELGDRWAGRVRLRMLGPLPPYDFVPASREG
jgi:hypothetical protein